jgi:hypothetical protein
LLNNRLTYRSAANGNRQKDIKSSAELADTLTNFLKINISPDDLQKSSEPVAVEIRKQGGKWSLWQRHCISMKEPLTTRPRLVS